jgi:type II secretory pathway pseudopilin PulG
MKRTRTHSSPGLQGIPMLPTQADGNRGVNRPRACCGRFFMGTASAWAYVTTLDSLPCARRMLSPSWSRARQMLSPSLGSPNRGYSLLELLVYVAVFAIGVNLFVSLLGTGSRLSAMNTLTMSRMEGVREVEEAFMAYTRRAIAVAAEAGDFKTGPDRLVLKMPPGQTDGFDYAVLGVLREANRFAVMGLAEKSGGLEVSYMKTLRQPLDIVAFEVEDASPRPLVKLRVKIKGENGERKQSFVEHRSIATPRGVGG